MHCSERCGSFADPDIVAHVGSVVECDALGWGRFFGPGVAAV
ncbi:MAG TPA: hypothetical protein PK890_04460 [Terrimesophilobacter sp.]|nr:hypothetical protein [Terrimesophilobacter sp.]